MEKEFDMRPANITKRIRFTKPGQTIIVPMGMIYPHAVKIETVRTDEDGQIIGDGVAVKMDGCSDWRVGGRMSVCLGWAKDG
jgi:hypothetical protein